MVHFGCAFKRFNEYICDSEQKKNFASISIDYYDWARFYWFSGVQFGRIFVDTRRKQELLVFAAQYYEITLSNAKTWFHFNGKFSIFTSTKQPNKNQPQRKLAYISVLSLCNAYQGKHFTASIWL